MVTLDVISVGIILCWIIEVLVVVIVRPIPTSFRLILLCITIYQIQDSLYVPSIMRILSVFHIHQVNCSIYENIWGLVTSMAVFLALGNITERKLIQKISIITILLGIILTTLAYIEQPDPKGCIGNYSNSPRWYSLFWIILLGVHLSTDLLATYIACSDAKKLNKMSKCGVYFFAFAFFLGFSFWFLSFLYFIGFSHQFIDFADMKIFPLIGYFFSLGLTCILFKYCKKFVSTF